MHSIKKLLFINESLTNKISYYHLLLLVFSLPFDLFYSHIILISFAVHTFLNVTKASWKSLFTLSVLILQSVFWITLIGITYSKYKNEGYSEVGRQLVILLVPILLCVTNLDLKKYRDHLLTSLVLSCILSVLYLYYDACRIIRFYGYPIKAIFTHAFTNHNFSNPIGMHATFFSLQVGLALVYLLSVAFKSCSVAYKFFYLAGLVILSAGLIQLCSKSVCAAVLIVVGLALPYFVLEGKKRYQFITVYMVIVVASFFLLSHSTTFKERYFTALEKDMSRPLPGETLDPRMARWGAAIILINRSPVIGHGSGSEVPLLKEEYFNRKFYNSFINELNAHNEYLSILLKSGVIGLLIYFITLAYGFKNAIATKDIVFFSFMILVAMVSLSENLLDVDKGTMFYGFFFSFFAFTADSKVALKTV